MSTLATTLSLSSRRRAPVVEAATTTTTAPPTTTTTTSTTPPPFAGILAPYTGGLQAAWSLNRRLLASYSGPLFRVRRSSDADEIDVGFDDDNGVDMTALSVFLNDAHGFVVGVYDQSGHGRDLMQTTAANQAKVWDAASGPITLGGKLAAAVHDAFTDFEAAFGAQMTPAAVCYTQAGRLTEEPGGYNGMLEGPGQPYAPDGAILIWQPDAATVQAYQAFGVRGSPATVAAGTEAAIGTVFGPGEVMIYRDGATLSTGSYTPAFSFNRFGLWAGSLNTGAKLAEAVLWFGDQAGALAAVQINQKGYYGL